MVKNISLPIPCFKQLKMFSYCFHVVKQLPADGSVHVQLSYNVIWQCLYPSNKSNATIQQMLIKSKEDIFYYLTKNLINIRNIHYDIGMKDSLRVQRRLCIIIWVGVVTVEHWPKINVWFRPGSGTSWVSSGDQWHTLICCSLWSMGQWHYSDSRLHSELTEA